MLPKFPEFANLDLSHKDVLQEIANRFPSYSDFNFVSLFTWDTDNSVMISSLNENLVIRFKDYLTGDSFYSLLGTSKIDETIKVLLEYSKKQGENNELMLVPHSVAMKVSGDQHIVIEDRDNHDYLLSVADLVEFRTNKYRGKKNLFNRYQRLHGEKTETKSLDLSIPENRAELERVLQDWQLSRNKDNQEVRNEFIAIKRALENAKILNLQAYGLFVDHKLAAFTLFEILPNKVAVIHFDKADTRYVGIFEHLKHSFAKHIASLDIETINYEQDLGLEGLRRAKESYHPVDYLKKYRIKSKD